MNRNHLSAGLLALTIALVAPSAWKVARAADIEQGLFGSAPQVSATGDAATGQAHASLVFQLNSARGAVQPQLGLTYSSGSGTREAGQGWGFSSLPSIQRTSLSNAPAYTDDDRLTLSGQALVPICKVAGDNRGCPNEEFPKWANGWLYYRAELEGAFVRVFWSPDRRTFRVQWKSGETMELGEPLAYPKLGGGGTDTTAAGQIHRWNVVRRFDTMGGVDAPKNVIVYQWQKLGAIGLGYLTDIFDTPSVKEGPTELANYEHHVHLWWQSHEFPRSARPPIWRALPDMRLAGVDITSLPDIGTGARLPVRRYHVGYKTISHQSYLYSFEVEGRCDDGEEQIINKVPFVLAATKCDRIPATNFWYSQGVVTDNPRRINVSTSGLENDHVSLLDIDSNGLPDFVEPGVAKNATESYVQFAPLPNSGADWTSSFMAAPFKVLAWPAPPGEVFTTIFSPSHSTTVVADLFGTGRPDAFWYYRYQASGTIVEQNGYSPRLVNGKWTWDLRANFPTDQSVDYFNTFTDIDGDGLVDGWDIDWTAVTTRTADGQTHPFAKKLTPSRPNMQQGISQGATGPFVDMNGDGLADLVSIVMSGPDNGVWYWPGDGTGGFGDKRRMTGGWSFVPWKLLPEQESLGYVHDVNGDGLADFIVAYDLGIEIFFGQDGSAFEDKSIFIKGAGHIAGWNWQAGHAPLPTFRITFADMNGSGTDDIVVFTSAPISYIDVFDGQRDGLLEQIRTGLGASTYISYQSLAEADGAAQKSGKPWATHSPRPAHVVTSIKTTNHHSDTRVLQYSYEDPAYDGWERAFLGFRKTRVTSDGDTTSPSSTIETTFYMDDVCQDVTQTCFPNVNDPYRSLRGRPVLSEAYDEKGVYLSTTHWEYHLGELMTGSDGRTVRFAYNDWIETYLYDTAKWKNGSSVKLTVNEIKTDNADKIPPTKRDIIIRMKGATRLLKNMAFDGAGNLTYFTDFGRVNEDGSPIDEAVISQTTPELTASDTRWQWKETFAKLTPFSTKAGRPAGQPRVRSYKYDANGNPEYTLTDLAGTLPLDRFHEDATKTPASKGIAASPAAASANGSVQLSHMVYNDRGVLTRVEGAGGRCTKLGYDETHDHLPAVVTVFANGCDKGGLSTIRTFDRGFEVARLTSLPTGSVIRTHFDTFGRVDETTPPDPDLVGSLAISPSIRVTYPRPDEMGDINKIKVEVRNGDDGYRTAWTYLDGFGQVVASFEQADAASDGGQWIVHGMTKRNAKGLVTEASEPWFLPGDLSTFSLSATYPISVTRSEYDSFGRVLKRYDLQGNVASTYEYSGLVTRVYDANNARTTYQRDGHGWMRNTTQQLKTAAGLDSITTAAEYEATGEIASVTQSHSLGHQETISRWIQRDSMGRTVLNAEPNTSVNFAAPESVSLDLANAGRLRAWRYAYDDADDLVGTSDARGCGKNMAYDGMGRLLWDDFSPCTKTQAPYSEAFDNGTGTEALYVYDGVETGQTGDFGPDAQFLKGKLVAVSDRASHTRFAYDGRGRGVGVARRLARPGMASSALASRYETRWSRTTTSFNDADQVKTKSTGASVDALMVTATAGSPESLVSFEYTARGVVKSIGSSYGPLVTKQGFDADGALNGQTFADPAATYSKLTYNGRRLLETYTVARDTAGPWLSTGAGYTPPSTSSPTTLQQKLQALRVDYDAVGNPHKITDERTPEEWLDGYKPVDRTLEYDDLRRLTSVLYDYKPTTNATSKDDKQESPFKAEIAQNKLSAVPSRQLATRVRSQSFTFDWNGNSKELGDDANATFDRSLGTITNGDAQGGHPHQLTSASGIAAKYDDAGNLVDLSVTRQGACTATSGKCTHRFAYEWDELGRLAHARRWDYAGTIPSSEPIYPKVPSAAAAVADLTYAYDAGSVRVIKTAKDTTTNVEVYSAEVFDSLRLNHATWDAAKLEYTRTASSEAIYLANGLARVVYAQQNPAAGISGDRRVFLELGDHLGSTGIVIDLKTSELVERATYQAFGAAESDYRPERWGSFREDYRFTGKEEDVEVGLVYFGARFYSPGLGRWLSPDPLAVHSLGSDLNPYAFVRGSPAKLVDPDGLDCIGAECGPNPGMTIVLPWLVTGNGSTGNTGASNGGSTATTAAAPETPPYVGPYSNEGSDDAAWDAARMWAKSNPGLGMAFGTAGAVTPFGFIIPAPPGVNGAFMYGQATGQIAVGLALILGGATGDVGALGADLTGIGAVIGVPAGVVCTAAVAKGMVLVTAGLYNMQRAGWSRGGPITQATARGNYPKWDTIRERYWKIRAEAAKPGEFTNEQLAQMKAGDAPSAKVVVKDNATGQISTREVTKELHHMNGHPGTPGFDEPVLLREVWPWEHAAVDPSRQTGYTFIRFVQ